MNFLSPCHPATLRRITFRWAFSWAIHRSALAEFCGGGTHQTKRSSAYWYWHPHGEAVGAAVGTIEALARTWPGIDQLRVAVVVTNRDAVIFWRKLGFVATGEIKPKYGPYVDDIVILEKQIYANPSGTL